MEVRTKEAMSARAVYKEMPIFTDGGGSRAGAAASDFVKNGE